MLFSKDQNGEQYSGDWKDGVPGGGKGFYINELGDRIEGVWVEG